MPPTHVTLSRFLALIPVIPLSVKLQPEIEYACNRIKQTGLSQKCRIHRHLREMEVIESLPLRQKFPNHRKRECRSHAARAFAENRHAATSRRTCS